MLSRRNISKSYYSHSCFFYYFFISCLHARAACWIFKAFLIESGEKKQRKNRGKSQGQHRPLQRIWCKTNRKQVISIIQHSVTHLVINISSHQQLLIELVLELSSKGSQLEPSWDPKTSPWTILFFLKFYSFGLTLYHDVKSDRMQNIPTDYDIGRDEFMWTEQ